MGERHPLAEEGIDSSGNLVPLGRSHGHCQSPASPTDYPMEMPVSAALAQSPLACGRSCTERIPNGTLATLPFPFHRCSKRGALHSGVGPKCDGRRHEALPSTEEGLASARSVSWRYGPCPGSHRPSGRCSPVGPFREGLGEAVWGRSGSCRLG